MFDTDCPRCCQSMYKSESHCMYACQDADCEYGHGIPREDWSWAYLNAGYVFCGVCDEWHRPPVRTGPGCFIEGQLTGGGQSVGQQA